MVYGRCIHLANELNIHEHWQNVWGHRIKCGAWKKRCRITSFPPTRYLRNEEKSERMEWIETFDRPDEQPQLF